jgi:hypothetical protein
MNSSSEVYRLIKLQELYFLVAEEGLEPPTLRI